MSRELRVGLVVFFALVSLIIAIFLIGDQEGVWKSKYELRILYDDVYGLLPGSQVRLAGLRVGSVKDITFSQALPGKLEVIIKIDKKVQPRIKEDSKATIGTQGLLGDKTIEITPGSAKAKALEAGQYIEAGKSTSIEALFARGGEVVDNLAGTSEHLKSIARKINEGSGSLGLFINDPQVYFDLQKLLQLTETLTRQIKSGKGTFAKLVTDSSLYVELRNLMANTNTFFDTLAANEGTLGRLMRDPEPFEDLKTILNNWNILTDRIMTGEGTAGKLLSNDSLYINLNRTLDRAEALLQDLRENPGRYIRFRIF